MSCDGCGYDTEKSCNCGSAVTTVSPGHQIGIYDHPVWARHTFVGIIDRVSRCVTPMQVTVAAKIGTASLSRYPDFFAELTDMKSARDSALTGDMRALSLPSNASCIFIGLVNPTAF